jgi:RHS repeat-associated protein
MGHKTIYEYDARGNRTRTVGPLGHATSFTFNSYGQLLTGIDARQNAADPSRATFSNTYDRRTGNLLFSTNNLGEVTSFTYDDDNRLRSATDPLGNKTIYGYYRPDESGGCAGDLKSVTTWGAQQVLIHEASYTYDANGNRRTETIHRKVDGRDESISTTHIYDGQNRLVETRDALYDPAVPALHSTKTAYNALGQPEIVVDKLGRQTTYTYDVRGNLIQTAYPSDANTPRTVRRTVYDAQNRVICVQDRAQPSNPADAFSSTVGPAQQTIYDLIGRVLRVERLTNVTVLMEADAASGFLFSTAVGGTKVSATSAAYDAAGRMDSSTDARGYTTYYGYDDAGRRTSVTNALGQVTRLVYDAVGNQTRFTDALGRTTDYEYDERNRCVRVIHPLTDGTNAVRYIELSAYDALDRRLAETNQEGIVTRYGYDGLGRLTAVTNAASTGDEMVTLYEYDEVGNLLKMTDANQSSKPSAQQKHSLFTYDKLGRRIKHVLPEGQSESFFYDAVGNVVTHTNFDGRIIEVRYDSLNRIAKKFDRIHGENNPWLALQYNPNGQRRTMVDASGLTRYVYDPQNRLRIRSTPQGDLTYTYDANGNIIQLQTSLSYGFDDQGKVNSSWQRPEGLDLAYEWDPLDRLAVVTQHQLAADANATMYEYDAVGNLESVIYPNGVSHGCRYDSLNRLVQLSVANGNIPLLTYGYAAGPAGYRQRAAETNHVRGTALDRGYGYDLLYRLKQETLTGGPNPQAAVNYAYDKVGNRLSRTSTLAGLPNRPVYTYDSNDRLISDQDESNARRQYEYDNNGNTLRGEVTPPQAEADQYDDQNRLTRRSLAGKVIELIYNGDGQRVGKRVTENGVTIVTQYLVDERNPTGYSQVLEERDGATGSILATYSYGLQRINQQRLSGVNTSEQVRFYGYDGQGSVRLLTDLDGSLTDTYSYDAFGVLIAQEHLNGVTPNTYLYAGEQYDPDLGLYYNRARYLNPNTGRFWTRDSFDGSSDNPISSHKYLYCHASPVNQTDPSGQYTVEEVTVVSSESAYLRTQGAQTTAPYAAGARTAAQVATELDPALFAPQIGQSVAGRAFAWMLIGIISAGHGATLWDALETSPVELERMRVAQKTRIEEEANSRCPGGKLLFYYRDRATIMAAAASGLLRASAGAPPDFPAGAYGSDIPPWDTTYTQSQLAYGFYGSAAAADSRGVGHFVAFCADESWRPLLKTLTPGITHWNKPAPAGSGVNISVLGTGVNLMPAN